MIEDYASEKPYEAGLDPNSVALANVLRFNFDSAIISSQFCDAVAELAYPEAYEMAAGLITQHGKDARELLASFPRPENL